MSAVDIKQAPARLGRLGIRPRTTDSSAARSGVWSRIWRDRIMLLLLAPGVIYFVLFRYIPLLGNVIAFQDYLPFLGFAESPFVGLENFRAMFADAAFRDEVQLGVHAWPEPAAKCHRLRFLQCL